MSYLELRTPRSELPKEIYDYQINDVLVMYYGLLEYREDGFLYVSDKADGTFKLRIAVDLPDHSTNYVLLSHYDSYIANLRFLFDHGSVRFKNLKCKSAFMRLLNYSMD